MTKVPELSRRQLLASALAVHPLASAVEERPNVLVFMTDQESAMVPASLNRKAFYSLRRRGMTFTNAFCNTPQCSPARSSLLTGLEPHRTGVLTNVDKTSLGRPLSPGIPTIGTVFREKGYSTGYFGKWHLGDDHSGLQSFGFREHYDGSDIAVSQKAAAWIKSQRSPWLAWVSILSPHDIYNVVAKPATRAASRGVHPPKTTRVDLAGKPSAQTKYLNEDQGRSTLKYTAEDWVRYRTFYCDLLEKADECLAAVLDALEPASNTVVVYTSDHGDALGEHGLPFKGPFMYEPLIRIPLVIAAPSLKSASLRSDFAASVDLAPTLAGLAGWKWPTSLDGRDLSRGSSGRGAVFLEYYGKQHWVSPIRTIRAPDWKLNCYRNGDVELYDLAHDPLEVKSLAGTPAVAEVQRKLQARLDRWWSGSPAHAS
jgi:choline-sulfatase